MTHRMTPLGFGVVDIADQLVTLTAIPSCTCSLGRLHLIGPAFATALRVNGENVLDALHRQIPIRAERGWLIELELRPLIPESPMPRWLRYLWRTRPGAVLFTLCRVKAPRVIMAAIMCTVDDSL